MIEGHEYDDQQRAHRKKGRRLDEHGGDRLVQSTDPSWGRGSGADVPAAQDEPDDDHEGEEDIGESESDIYM